MIKTWVLLKDGEERHSKQAETQPTIASTKGEYFETVNSDPPEHNPETQKLIESWSVKWGKYRQEWEVVDKTPLEMWQHPDWAKKIIAPAALVMDDIGVKMLGWWQIMGFPIEREGDLVYLYCNQILPQHQAVVDQLQGVITIEDRPEHIE
jgi:hypothetical protein